MLELLPQCPVEPALHDILVHTRNATASLGIRMFVGGATARDLLLVHVHGQQAMRATRDVDIGLYVERWEQFEALKALLVEAGRFFEAQGQPHRLHYRQPGGIPLDLIPFGPIAGTGRTIAWPPGHDVVLDVAGFEEGLASAHRMDLGHALKILVCSLPSLSVLKLMAWRDRGRSNNKDATDFLALTRSYAAAGNMDRLYAGDGIALLHAANYDPDLAGAALLGQDAAVHCLPATRQQIADLLADAAWRQRLIDQVARAESRVGDDGGMRQTDAFISGYHEGFLSAMARAPAHAPGSG
ncbi:nucleotidyl transferase AbiEii/AbiGii toxin family protein [Acidovorax sp. NCPPB 4044]|uniref:nucleotidyl transferase AbiEii/AbiGii toxin family protein n=1 Tax=Acidovorax sp. NCPPB 4044 TaxID=2940490 RepID=UPI002303ED71|nr:nucleotidyl transferase AbiEii/AbiGii toxin family protein [Acidovorax sp. NCPPB 4044]MDA8523092.1 nucleotidyl transferase AbiEii/AbiGii toxin family protein [Acidovorax sp. NCPPB 4044]